MEKVKEKEELSLKGKIKVEVVEVPNTSRDVKNKGGKTKKILPGVPQTFAPVIDRNSGRIKTGTTVEEYDYVMSKDPLADKKDYKDFYVNDFLKINASGTELDLSIPRDFLRHRWLKYHPEVCTDLKTLNPSQHTLIMIDKEEEAKEKLSTIEYKMKAYTLFSDMMEDEIKDFLILYGKNPDNTSYKVAKSILSEHIEANPKKFVSLHEDAAKEYKIMFKKLMTNKIIEKRGGVYFYGEDVSLGATPEQVVENLRSVENQELYLNLINLLDE